MNEVQETASSFSPVDNEAPLRGWRRLGIVPPGEIGAGRRAALLAALSWLPIALWGLLSGRGAQADSGESLLQHYGVHVRCLLAIPLFVLAESALHRAGKAIARQFLTSGAVTPERRPAFEATTRGMIRLRDASLPWIFAVGVALAWSVVSGPDLEDDAISWAVAADGALGFGGWWFAYVARPLFLALLLGSIWRILLVACWMGGVGRRGLVLVPTHPDRTGGIGFVEKLPGAFAFVTLAMSAVVVSRWAHELLHHAAPLASFRIPALAFAVLWTLLLLIPLLALVPALSAARREAEPAYAALVGEQGRLVHRRWIEGAAVEDRALLDAPEIGPVADAAALYEAVRKMRAAPIGKLSILKILVPLAIPFLVLALLAVPLKQILLALVKVVV